MKINYKKYLFSAIWLTFPILLWNVIFASRLPAQFLPDIFWKDIPLPVMYGENILRTVIFAMPVFISLGNNPKKTGMGLVLDRDLGLLSGLAAALVRPGKCLEHQHGRIHGSSLHAPILDGRHRVIGQ
jgi:hypothetical protein